MKKITLVVCLSIVGFMGFSQQANQKEHDISNQEDVLTIDVGTMDFKDAEDQDLLSSNDFSEINFSSGSFVNTHELVHRSTNENNLENKFTEGAFSYNEYVLIFDIKKILSRKLKF